VLADFSAAMHRINQFIKELKRRKVFQVATIYLVTSWGAALGASELLPNFDVPSWIVRALIIVLLVCFPIVVALAWYFEWTSEGIVRDPQDVHPLDARQTAPGNARRMVQPTPQHHAPAPRRHADAMPTMMAGPPSSAAPTISSFALSGSALELSWRDASGNRTVLMDDMFTIGRESICEVVTLDPKASRRHVRIEPRGAGWAIVDLQSRNGTLIDGKPALDTMLPQMGQIQLGVGGQVFSFRILDHNSETMIAAIPSIPKNIPDGLN